MDLWWSCMSVSQWTSFDGVVTFGLADHALEKNGAVMVKWVQRTVLLQSCCDLTPRKSLKQFKITICQYQCYSISSHCAPFTGEQWLQPDLLEGFSDKKRLNRSESFELSFSWEITTQGNLTFCSNECTWFCMLSQCLCGFSLGTLVSSHSSNMHVQ